MSEFKAGTELRSAVSTTVVIVTMGSEGILTCGGLPMVPATTDQHLEHTSDPVDGVTLLGKRYQAPEGALQVLCTRQGGGVLALDGIPLDFAKPKVLPASD